MKPGIVSIWQELSLRTRLFLPLGVMFVVALILGAVMLRSFGSQHLTEENKPSAQSAEQIAGALNVALRIAANPQQTLDAFGQSLGKTPPLWIASYSWLQIRYRLVE